MNLQMPKAVCEIIDILHRQGYEAYAVGGCVRDSILGRKPDDWDITTSATPYQVKEHFLRTIDTGLQHGTVTVLMDGEGYEVTTYRIDGEYVDGRHPKEVKFTSDLLEDLRRRDFTINAMAYTPKTGLVDQFGGVEDLKNHVIRCVGEPSLRFEEDALRILRAVRFAAQLGFTIEEDTKKALKTLSPTLKKISAERIQTEIVKLLVSDRPQLWQIVYETGISEVVLPEFDAAMETPQNNPHHRGSVGEHILISLPYVRKDKVLRLTMLFHDLGKAVTRTTDEKGIDHFYGHAKEGQKIAKNIMRRLKFDNHTIQQVTNLIYWHDNRVVPEAKAVRRAINKVGVELFPLLLEVQYADIMAQSEYHREEKLERLDQVTKIYQDILERKECVSLKNLAVTGKDLIENGLKPGPQLGESLSELLELVLEDPSRNEKETLLKLWREKQPN